MQPPQRTCWGLWMTGHPRTWISGRGERVLHLLLRLICERGAGLVDSGLIDLNLNKASVGGVDSGMLMEGGV